MRCRSHSLRTVSQGWAETHYPLQSPCLTEVGRRSNARFAGLLGSVAPRFFHFLSEFCLQRFQVEARSLLHRREFDKGMRRLGDLLLNECEPPELECEPVVIGNRPVVLAI